MDDGQHGGRMAPSRAARAAAVERLRRALYRGEDEDILQAAAEVRALGAAAPDIPWEVVYDAERRTSAAAALRSALARGDDETTAQAWAHVTSIWPGYLSAVEHERGRAAFRRWGRALRKRDGEEMWRAVR